MITYRSGVLSNMKMRDALSRWGSGYQTTTSIWLLKRALDFESRTQVPCTRRGWHLRLCCDLRHLQLLPQLVQRSSNQASRTVASPASWHGWFTDCRRACLSSLLGLIAASELTSQVCKCNLASMWIGGGAGLGTPIDAGN